MANPARSCPPLCLAPSEERPASSEELERARAKALAAVHRMHQACAPMVEGMSADEVDEFAAQVVRESRAARDQQP